MNAIVTYRNPDTGVVLTKAVEADGWTHDDHYTYVGKFAVATCYVISVELLEDVPSAPTVGPVWIGIEPPAWFQPGYPETVTDIN